MSGELGRVIFITQFSPSPIGHGGQHRTYQIIHDLHTTLGTDCVQVLSLPHWSASRPIPPTPPLLRRILRSLKYRLGYYAENPLRLWFKTGYFSNGWMHPDFLRLYQQTLREHDKPLAVLIEHTGFASILEINAERGIPTIACIQNLESLDYGRAVDGARKETAARVGDLAVELNVLSRCHERLFISKVEAGMVGGLGLHSAYYPYVPVGEIRSNLQRVREARGATAQEAGLFLMLGSAGHHTTAEAFAWLVEQAQRHGLPAGVRIIVGGSGTDKLLPAGATVPRLECRGRLPQDELDQLLVKCQGVLVPQFRGFGALTRLSEMACGGVPVLVSRHPTLALDVPPGVQMVEDNWEAWSTAMSEFVCDGHSIAPQWDAYLAWEQTQPNPITNLLGGI
ncbi:hypothetical protein EYB53_008425 [Candidatus Chloroploca sp. M-50]|uniref:Glycosyltransferase n=1 Tax=Candidatus Chloroploca mongolica TaxID=2528176 RepID=A0ABS4D8G4_9CHLR|nr:hypothetical protein [Candidatus Chloroploca mongolica]MBP1465728.1 hypothetical protein [Candidatus Chloroploca mongolica]